MVSPCKDRGEIDPKDLMAVERSTTALIGTSISLIVLGFVVEKFELFLHIIAAELPAKRNADAKIPELQHIEYYNLLGIGIVFAGILLSLYTYRYYLRWIRHLQEGRIDMDKGIYFYISMFVSLIGLILLMTMTII